MPKTATTCTATEAKRMRLTTALRKRSPVWNITTPTTSKTANVATFGPSVNKPLSVPTYMPPMVNAAPIRMQANPTMHGHSER